MYQNASEEEIKDEFRNFVNRINAEIENWSEGGSDWRYTGTDTAYVNVARYDPLVAGTYIPLPAKLQSKSKGLVEPSRSYESIIIKQSLI